MRYFVFILMASLAGCMTGPPLEQLNYTESKELFAKLHQRCAEQGAPQGSSEFDACMRQELTREQSIRQERADRRKMGSRTTVCNRSFNTVICT